MSVTICALLFAFALPATIWGAVYSCAPLLNMGVLHGMTAISIGSLWIRRNAISATGRPSTPDGAATVSPPQVSLKLAFIEDIPRTYLQHAFFVGWIVCCAGAVFSFFFPSVATESVITHTWMGAVTLIAASVWFILARIAQATTSRMPSQPPLMNADISHALNELCLFSLIVAGVFLFGEANRSATRFVEFGANLWTLAWGTFGLVQGIAAFLDGMPMFMGLAVTIKSPFSRERLQAESSTSTANDAVPSSPSDGGSALRLQISKVGIFQSMIALCAVGWLLTGIVVVRPSERAIYFRLGRIEERPLNPGLHFTLPNPFGRIEYLPVLPIRIQAAGFSAEPRILLRTPLLWTKPHGNLELPFIIGSGTELVAVNALLQYRLKDEFPALRRYVLSFSTPEDLLSSLLRRVMTHETRTCTLEDLLTEGRDAWQRHLNERLRAEVRTHSEAIEIIDLSILSIHPPVEIAASYLDLVSARIDANATILEARGSASAELVRSRMMADTFVADAKVAAADRLMAIADESSQMESLAAVFAKSPEGVRRRAFCEVLSGVLEGKPLTLIDSNIPPETQLWIGDAPRSAREARPSSENRTDSR